MYQNINKEKNYSVSGPHDASHRQDNGPHAL